MAITKLEEKTFVYLKTNQISGISQKNGQPYEFNTIEFADPTTFENHTLNYKKGLNFSYLSKGEKINITLDVESGYRQSSVVVVDVTPVK